MTKKGAINLSLETLLIILGFILLAVIIVFVLKENFTQIFRGLL